MFDYDPETKKRREFERRIDNIESAPIIIAVVTFIVAGLIAPGGWIFLAAGGAYLLIRHWIRSGAFDLPLEDPDRGFEDRIRKEYGARPRYPHATRDQRPQANADRLAAWQERMRRS